MDLGLPEMIEKEHSPEWVALHLAIGLYVSRESTLGQAAQVAKLTQKQFQHELASRKIPLNYSMEDLQNDLEAVRQLSGK